MLDQFNGALYGERNAITIELNAAVKEKNEAYAELQRSTYQWSREKEDYVKVKAELDGAMTHVKCLKERIELFQGRLDDVKQKLQQSEEATKRLGEHHAKVCGGFDKENTKHFHQVQVSTLAFAEYWTGVHQMADGVMGIGIGR